MKPCLLGVRRITREDEQSVADNTKLVLSELCTNTQNCDLFKVGALSKLSFLISDRAATGKKANEILNTWVQEEFKKTCSSHCGPYFVLHGPCVVRLSLLFYGGPY